MIHFVWTDEPLPGWASRNIEEFRRLNPDKSVVVHSDASMLLPKYADIYHESTIHEQRSDWLRASILEQLGGWYFDCDCWPLRPLPRLDVGEKLACVCWANSCLNAMMYCEPHSPVWGHYEPSSPCDKLAGSHALNCVRETHPELFYPLGMPEWSAGRLDGINYDRVLFGMTPEAPEQQIVIHGS